MRFSVVIPTYNRSQLLRRAINSVLQQDFPAAEIVVIDDGSSDDTAEMLHKVYPKVRYFRQENSGVCAARNRGLQETSSPWAVCLDDDDVFLPGALRNVANRMSAFLDLWRYPVVQFAHGNGSMDQPFRIARLRDYISGSMRGDFMPVINRERLLRAGLKYPEGLRAGESLLWWRVAEEFGLPTWADRVGLVGTDAPSRITSCEYQLRHAREYAELQERILSDFGPSLAAADPSYHKKKVIGAAVYWLLAGERIRAWTHLRSAARQRLSLEVFSSMILCLFPRTATRRLFKFYRRKTNGWQS